MQRLCTAGRPKPGTVFVGLLLPRGPRQPCPAPHRPCVSRLLPRAGSPAHSTPAWVPQAHGEMTLYWVGSAVNRAPGSSRRAPSAPGLAGECCSAGEAKAVLPSLTERGSPAGGTPALHPRPAHFSLHLGGESQAAAEGSSRSLSWRCWAKGWHGGCVEAAAGHVRSHGGTSGLETRS